MEDRMTDDSIMCKACKTARSIEDYRFCTCCPFNRENTIHKETPMTCKCGRVLCRCCCRLIGYTEVCPECGRIIN